MPKIFDPMNIGKMELKNRFVRSATLENLAKETGEVSNELVKHLTRLAKGEIALIIPGFMYVDPLGRSYKYQTGIHHNGLINGLKKITTAIHDQGGKVAFQLVHSGIQTFTNLTKGPLLCPSGDILSPISFDYSKEMTQEEILDIIDAFISASERAVEAGADSIQLHAAHGYLINEFLSPFYNHREDKWGGSDENRFRILKELVNRIKKVIPREIPLLVKLNTDDYTPTEGITPLLASKYAKWLSEVGIDAIEVSCGSGFALFNMSRGEVPVQEIVLAVPDYLKQMAENIYQEMVGKYPLEEGYNLEAAKKIKPNIGKVPLILVGGLRTKSYMNQLIEKNYADFISMSRPFIKEPFLVKNFREGKQEKATCSSCNKCLAAIPHDYPIKCYAEKFPEERNKTVYFQK